MSGKDGDDWQYWRDRAEKTRAKADKTQDRRSKRRTLGLADFYERLAEQIEQRSSTEKSGRQSK
jgi:hypothetical protein